jgi:DNA repair protein RadA/Sms
VAKQRSFHACTECGGQTAKWQGQCPHCGAWNTLVETVAESAPTNRFAAAEGGGRLQRLSEISAREHSRIATGFEEFDRVLGGGLVAGGVVLIGGDPGIGKSTLLLQALARLAAGCRVLYVSGEESAEQVALRGRPTPAACCCSPRSTWRRSPRRSASTSRRWR